ncbi:uncharacterized protein LOC120081054 [Benincasa hispida]|uniref:uncharacterized protein LOC120081054 n=1 Tax=Benincasa hispida TaxID=102211 RepID=UPI0019013A40|nr:uncharacterized protein LOC120081054 [Benincasa hispida]
MREITRATFEVDDFFRIVDILHKRLEKFEAKDWRGSYNAVILLEHVLTHGPLSFAKEFGDDNNKQVLREMNGFHFVDDKGFNWGQSVRKLSGRVLKLIEDEEFLRQERLKARNLTSGIHGFGNLTRRSFPDSRAGTFDYKQRVDLAPALAREILVIDEKEEEIRDDLKGKLKEEADSESELKGDGVNIEIDHPFSPIKHHRLSQSLLHNSQSSPQQN